MHDSVGASRSLSMHTTFVNLSFLDVSNCLPGRPILSLSPRLSRFIRLSRDDGLTRFWTEWGRGIRYRLGSLSGSDRQGRALGLTSLFVPWDCAI